MENVTLMNAYVMSDIPRMEKKGGYVDQQVL